MQKVKPGYVTDLYVAWADNDRTCVRVNLAMKTSVDGAPVRDGLRQWAADHPGTDLKLQGAQTTITRCA